MESSLFLSKILLRLLKQKDMNLNFIFEQRIWIRINFNNRDYK